MNKDIESKESIIDESSTSIENSLETNNEINSIEEVAVDEELVAKVQEQEKKQPLLIVRNLSKYFKKGSTFFKAVNNANFDVQEGDFFGIIGESGSGKSTIGKLLIRLLQSDSGTTIFDNNIISDKKISKKINNWLTSNMQMIFQDPMSSLNPKKNVLNLIAEPLIIKKTLKSEAKNIIKEHIKINPYFQYTFKQKDFEISKDFNSYYYPEMIKVYHEQIKKISNYKYDKNLKFDENKFNFLSILLDLDEKSKKINYSLYKHADDIKNIFVECAKMHTNKENHETEIAVFELTEKVNELKQKLKYSSPYLETKNKLVKLQEELDYHLSNSTEKYREQIKNYVQGAKESYKKEIETLKNQLMITQNFILGFELKIKMEIKKTAIEILDYVKGLELLSLFDAREIINKSEEWVENLYAPLFDEIKILKKLKIEKDELAKKFIVSNKISDTESSIIKNSEASDEFNELVSSILEDIKNKNFELKNSIDAIDVQYKKIADQLENLKVNEILISTNFFELFKIEEYISYQQSLVDINKTNVYKKQIDLLSSELTQIKKLIPEWKKSEDYLNLKQTYQTTIEQLKKANDECKIHYQNDIELFNNNVKPEIDKHKIIWKQWSKELIELKRKLKLEVLKQLKEITNLLKHNNDIE
ncbi:MAG: ATP-binding cassette domain-containing protein, partial [Ureaplasma sp.]|nr:ATP-binding cassette domain-containing protein [Ureaplasma sp.]